MKVCAEEQIHTALVFMSVFLHLHGAAVKKVSFTKKEKVFLLKSKSGWWEMNNNEWQTIDTAPKDGTKVLVVCVINLSCGGTPAIFIAQYSVDYGWVTNDWTMNEFKPIYWMPLPELPVLQG